MNQVIRSIADNTNEFASFFQDDVSWPGDKIVWNTTRKNKTFHKVYITIDKKSQTIYSTKVLEKNGNKYTYTVNNLNGQATINDATFVFDKKKYPGVEEVDLR